MTTPAKLVFENYTPLYSRRSTPLHAMVINCGHERVFRNYNWDGRKRGGKEFFIWQYTLAGAGKLRINELEYPVGPGEAMLLIVPEDHCYFLPEGSPEWEFVYLTLNGSEVIRFAAELRRRRGFLLRLEADAPAVRAAWEVLRLLRECPGADRFEVSGAAYRFMMTLLAATDRDDTAGPDRFLNRIHDYVLAHLGETITVTELARVANCSRAHFSRRFRLAQGMSPQEFIIQLKMHLAVRLLQTTNATVKEIAAQCGFEDTSYFCRVFRRCRQLTPGAFRSGAPPVAD